MCLIYDQIDRRIDRRATRKGVGQSIIHTYIRTIVDWKASEGSPSFFG